MTDLTGVWSWCGWPAISALGTVSAAIVVAIYTWETHRLRRTADDQLEAMITPFLMLISGRAMNMEWHKSAGRLDRSEDQPWTDIHVGNEGKGVALDTMLWIRTNVGDGSEWGYELSAIPAGKSITLVVPREDFFGDENLIAGDRSFQVKFVAEYQSVARKRYRTRINMRGWDQYGESEDRSSLEYERCDDPKYKHDAKERLRRIARRGSRVCHLCGDEISKGTPFKEASLERRWARVLRKTRDPNRAPRWRIGLWGKVPIIVCADCERKVTPPNVISDSSR